jgi:hypothetical protein
MSLAGRIASVNGASVIARAMASWPLLSAKPAVHDRSC